MKQGRRHGRIKGVSHGSREGSRTALVVTVAALSSVSLVTSCSSGLAGTEGPTPGVVSIAAAENFWGSIVGQLGGAHAHVVSIITNPNTDPHSYEPTAADARTIASAQLVVENGIGYDPWAARLIAADKSDQTVLDVGKLLGIPDGGNPHVWYNPGDVRTVIERMVLDLDHLDPRYGTYFAARERTFETVDLRQYDETVAAIRAQYSGTPVGASESIFAMLAPALGLDLITPYSFLKAISEGTDVSASDKQTIDNQIKNHQIAIYVYNSQNVTPDVRAQLDEVKAEHIPFATITETLAPATATYEAWQTKQLHAIEAALARALPSRQ